MRRLKRYICLVGLLALLAAALTGCGFSDDSVEELFTLPRMAEEYTGLTQELEALITQGYEYASPTGGRNIQSVQMADLDGDGQQEALAFFRMSSDEKPLKIFVFKIEGDSYARYCTIESSGTAIDSIYYEDLTGDGRRELIVGWRISAEVQTVAVYTVAREPVALMSSGYTRFTMQDLNGDGIPSLLVLRTDADSQPVAEFYGWQDEQMGVAYRCGLGEPGQPGQRSAGCRHAGAVYHRCGRAGYGRHGYSGVPPGSGTGESGTQRQQHRRVQRRVSLSSAAAPGYQRRRDHRAAQSGHQLDSGADGRSGQLALLQRRRAVVHRGQDVPQPVLRVVFHHTGELVGLERGDRHHQHQQ